MRTRRWMAWVFALSCFGWVALTQGKATAAEPAAEAPAKPAKEAPHVPFPLHTIEGSGGVVLVPVAYLCNPPAAGETFGKPAIGTTYVGLDNKHLDAFTVTETIRPTDGLELELGYSFMSLQLGSLRDKIGDATGIDIDTSRSRMHTLSVRTPLIRENAGADWVPAVTVGAHYKNNEDVNSINRKLGGLLEGLGMEDNDSVDFTLSATKSVAEPLTQRPMILTLGGRLTEASHIGLLGFDEHYSPELEASVVYLVLDNLALASEFRSKPDDLDHVPGLIGHESNWWDVGAAYIFNENLTATVAYGSFGTILDESVNGGWVFALKYDF